MRSIYFVLAMLVSTSAFCETPSWSQPPKDKIKRRTEKVSGHSVVDPSFGVVLNSQIQYGVSDKDFEGAYAYAKYRCEKKDGVAQPLVQVQKKDKKINCKKDGSDDDVTKATCHVDITIDCSIPEGVYADDENEIKRDFELAPSLFIKQIDEKTLAQTEPEKKDVKQAPAQPAKQPAKKLEQNGAIHK